MLHTVGVLFTFVPRMSKGWGFAKEGKIKSSYKIKYITENKSRILGQCLKQKKKTKHTKKKKRKNPTYYNPLNWYRK